MSRAYGLKKIIFVRILLMILHVIQSDLLWHVTLPDVGLESYYNSTLMGADGRQYGYINDNSDVEQTIIDPKDGQSIVTSLDVGAQQIVEKYVNGFKTAMGAKNIGVIAMKPSTVKSLPWMAETAMI